MFDEGQKLDHPYHRTKFESEKLARTQTNMPWRVYRPAIVVGNSQTGEMDKIDGPYYFFTAIKMARHYLPGWFPLDRPRARLHEHRPGRLRRRRAGPHRPSGRTRRPGLPPHQPQVPALGRGDEHVRQGGRARARSSRCGSTPSCSRRCPRARSAMLMQLPAAKGVRKALLADFGIPDEVLGYIALTARVRHPRHRAGAGRARASRSRRSRATRPSCGTTGSATSTPTCSRTAASRAPSTARPC